MSERERDERPWGNYVVVDEGDGYKVKQITVFASKRLSYQYHQHRAEHWFVVTGHAVATVDGIDIVLKPGSSIDVPQTTPHRIANTGENNLVFIEVQTGSYLGEDDITRLDDDFGRVG